MSLIASGISAKALEVIESVMDPYDLRSAWTLTLPFAADTSGSGSGEGGGEGGSGEGGGDEGGSGSSGDGSGSGSEEGNEGTGSAEGIKDPEKKRLSDEAAAHRVKAKELQTALEQAQAKLKEIEDKDKDELTKAQESVKTLNETVEKLQSQVKTQAVKLAFYDSGEAAKYRNPARALRLLDLDDIEPDDEGQVDASEIKKRSEALLKSDSYLAKSDDDDEAEAGATDASGAPMNGKKGSKKELDREKLASKYPALRR